MSCCRVDILPLSVHGCLAGLNDQIEDFYLSKPGYTHNTYMDAADNFLDLMEEVAHMDCCENILKKMKHKKEMVRGVYWPYARMFIHMWDEFELEDAKFVSTKELRLVNRSLRPPFTKKHVLTWYTLNNQPTP